MKTLAERVKSLEDKVAKLEGGNLLKEDSEKPTGKEEKVFRPSRPL